MAKKAKAEPVVYDEATGMVQRKIDNDYSDNILEKFSKRTNLYEDDEENLNNVLYMKTGCLPYDLVTGGKGVPRGRMTMVYSAPGTGKSTTLFTVARGMCQNGFKVLFVDAEGSDDTAKAMGLIGHEGSLQVPEKSFKYVSVSTWNQLDDITDAFLRSEYDHLILDSISAVGRSRAVRRAAGKALEDAAAIGADARLQSQYLKELWVDLKDSDRAMTYICQTTTKIDMRNPANTRPEASGSLRSKYLCNLQIDMKPSTLLKDGVKVVGRMANLYADKNRHASPMVNIPATVFFGRGVSNIDMLVQFCVWRGYFHEGAAGWWTMNVPGEEPDQRVQGRIGVNNMVRKYYPDLVEAFYEDAPRFLNYIQNGYVDVPDVDDPSQSASAGSSEPPVSLDDAELQAAEGDDLGCEEGDE